MKNFRIIRGFFVLLGVILFPSAEWADVQLKNVHILHSYNQGMPWTENLQDSIMSILSYNSDFIYSVTVDYMDTKQFYSEDYLSVFDDLYRYKYSEQSFDVVIACDNNAYDYVLKNRNTLFKDIPIVFSGVNFFEPAIIEGILDITGVVEAINIASNIALILQLHPQTETIYILNDQSTTGQAILKSFNAIKNDFTNRVNFEYHDQLSMDEAITALSQVSDGTVVLLFSFVRDRLGVAYSYEKSALLISENCPVPIYGLWDFLLNYGVTGGFMLSGYQQGKTAAESAIRILNGAPASDIPVVTESPNRYMFDYREMIKYNIRKSELPKDSEMINTPETFFYHNRIILIICGLIIIILVLLLFRIRCRHIRTRNEYLNSEDRYRKLVEVSFEAIMIHNDHVILDINPKFEELSGYSAEEAIGMKVYDLVMPEFHDLIRERISKNIEKTSQVKLFRKDGTVMWMEVKAKNITYDGKHARVVILRDITELKEAQEAIKRWLNFEQTVSHILSQFMDIRDFSKVITVSLGDIATFTGANHAFVFLINEQTQSLKLTFEWVGADSEAQLDKLEDYDIIEMHWALDKLANGESLVVPDTTRLPVEAGFLSDLLRASGVYSILTVPLIRDNRMIGLIGLDTNQQNIYWNEEHIGLIRLFSEVLSKALEKDKELL